MASTRPWADFTQADYTLEQWIAACLVNLNTGPKSSWSKGNAKLPVREPSGALNVNGVHSAAAALAGARGGVQAPPDAKRAAARKLIALYAQLKEQAPDSLRRLAG
jgi:hypothetical protein